MSFFIRLIGLLTIGCTGHKVGSEENFLFHIPKLKPFHELELLIVTHQIYFLNSSSITLYTRQILHRLE